jgi:thioesterase domain-containing protein
MCMLRCRSRYSGSTSAAPAYQSFRTWFNELPHYANLARHLGEDQPIVTIAPPAGRMRTDLPSTTEQWAAFCLRRLDEVRCTGPYLLKGWSFGGVVALEMARALIARGGDVRRVLMVDTWVPRNHDLIERSFPHRMIVHLSQLLDLEPVARRAYVRERLEGRRAELTSQLKGWWARRTATGAGTQKDPYSAKLILTNRGDQMSLLKRAVWVAYLKYRSRPLAVPVSLYRCAASSDKKEDVALGWSQILRGDFESVEVPGDHFSMFEEPHVTILAERITRTLSLVNAARDPATTSAPDQRRDPSSQ